MRGKIRKRLLAWFLVVVMMVGMIPTQVFAESTLSNKIYLDETKEYVHYFTMMVKNADTGKAERVEVFCMNNSLHWPEHGMTYDPNTLTTGDAEIDKELHEKLRRVLYAGYPNNGAGLYELIPDGAKVPDITVEKFNDKMILDPAVLGLFQNEEGFEGLADMVFTTGAGNTGTLNHWDSKEYQMIVKMLEKDFIWSEEDKTKSDVFRGSVNFAAFSCVNLAGEVDPEEYSGPDDALMREIYTDAYAADYYVDIEGAYGATQEAVWNLLIQFGLPNNENDGINPSPLALNILSFANGTTPMPDASVLRKDICTDIVMQDIQGVSVDAANPILFSYNYADGKWYSQHLVIPAQTGSDGMPLYTTEYLVTYDGKTRKAATDVPFQLVSDSKPAAGELTAKAEVTWPSELFQFGTKSLHVDGKGYQNMAGLYLHQVPLSLTAVYESAELEEMTVEKIVAESSKEAAVGQDFWIQADIDLKDSDGKRINGIFPIEKTAADGTVTAGTLYHWADPDKIMQFPLKDGEKVTIKYLPAGTSYTVKERALSEDGSAELGNWIPQYNDSAMDEYASVIGDSNQVIIRNRYSEPVEMRLAGTKKLVKVLNGEETEEELPVGNKAFSFILWPDVHGYPMPEGSAEDKETNRLKKVVFNTAEDKDDIEGEIDFGSIRFNRPGEYKYTIEEQQVTEWNVSRDTSHWHLTVNVTEGSGTELVAEAELEQHGTDHTVNETFTYPEWTGTGAGNLVDGIAFVNYYNTSQISKEIRVKKAIRFLNAQNNVSVSREGFVFDVEPDPEIDGLDIEDYPEFENGGDDPRTCQIVTGQSGEAVTGVLTFTDEWFVENSNGKDKIRLRYRITENEEAYKENGDYNEGIVSYSKETAYAVIEVSRKLAPGIDLLKLMDHDDYEGELINDLVVETVEEKKAVEEQEEPAEEIQQEDPSLMKQAAGEIGDSESEAKNPDQIEHAAGVQSLSEAPNGENVTNVPDSENPKTEKHVDAVQESTEIEKGVDAVQESTETEKTVDVVQESTETEKTVDAVQESAEAEKNDDAVQESAETEKTVDAVQESAEAEKNDDAVQESVETEKGEDAVQESAETKEDDAEVQLPEVNKVIVASRKTKAATGSNAEKIETEDAEEEKEDELPSDIYDLSAVIYYIYGDQHTEDHPSKEPAVITNGYQASGELLLHIQKTFSDKYVNYTPEAGESYQFLIDDRFARNEKDEQGKPIGYEFAEEMDTITVKDGEEIRTFRKITLTYDGEVFQADADSITFLAAGNYRFMISELDESVERAQTAGMSHMTYSKEKWIIDVTVTDDGKGHLLSDAKVVKAPMLNETEETEAAEGAAGSEELTADAETAEAGATASSVVTVSFENMYIPYTSLEGGITIRKVLSGREWNDKDYFEFMISHGEDGSEHCTDPNGHEDELSHVSHGQVVRISKASLLEENGSTASQTMEHIIFRKPGTYEFRIREYVPKYTGNMVYDTSVYTLKVTVSQKDGTNELEYRIDGAQTVEFVNEAIITVPDPEKPTEEKPEGNNPGGGNSNDHGSGGGSDGGSGSGGGSGSSSNGGSTDREESGPTSILEILGAYEHDPDMNLEVLPEIMVLAMTGDTNRSALLAVLCLAAMAGMAILFFRRPVSQKKEEE